MQLVCLPVKADDKADYLKLAQKVRQEVWDNTPADFKKRTVPAKYKNESAVILSYYRKLSTDYYRKATTELFVSAPSDTSDRLRGHGAYADTTQRQESLEGLF